MQTSFLPLAKVMPKELWPIGDKPVIEYLLQEAKDSGIDNIIFVISEDTKIVLNYLKHDSKLKKTLKDNDDEVGLKALESLDDLIDNLNFASVKPTRQLGHGYAILQAQSKILRDEPFAVMTNNHIVDSDIPCMQQLMDIYDTSLKPVVALKSTPGSGNVQVEKIANRVYKIKKMLDDQSGDFTMIGKYILTPVIFEFLKKNTKQEITLTDTFSDMMQTGETIYGYEFYGQHLEIKDKESYLKTNSYFLNK